MTVKAVFHIDELSKWEMVLHNVQNLIRAVDASASQIEVLANAEAVKFYGAADPGEDGVRMKELARLGVHFVACRNALNGWGVRPEQLPPFVEIAPSGVLELIEKQAEGWAYIKP